MDIDAATSALPALLQLASPALPTGAFSYSQGLEAAQHAGIVTNEAQAADWIASVWQQSFSVRELPVVVGAWRAFDSDDEDGFVDLDRRFLASRDSAEMRAEARQVGSALQRWLQTLLPQAPETDWAQRLRPCAPAAFALCAHSQGLAADHARLAYAFAWLENQVQAAVKIVPLGQTAGQRMLIALRRKLFEAPPEQPWSFAPVAAILSMRHERQYTRLFRS